MCKQTSQEGGALRWLAEGSLYGAARPKPIYCRCHEGVKGEEQTKTHPGRAYWSRIEALLGPVQGLLERSALDTVR